MLENDIHAICHVSIYLLQLQFYYKWVDKTDKTINLELVYGSSNHDFLSFQVKSYNTWLWFRLLCYAGMLGDPKAVDPVEAVMIC